MFLSNYIGKAHGSKILSVREMLEKQKIDPKLIDAIINKTGAEKLYKCDDNEDVMMRNVSKHLKSSDGVGDNSKRNGGERRNRKGKNVRLGTGKHGESKEITRRREMVLSSDKEKGMKENKELSDD